MVQLQGELDQISGDEVELNALPIENVRVEDLSVDSWSNLLIQKDLAARLLDDLVGRLGVVGDRKSKM